MMNLSVPAISVLMGMAILFLGHRLFWLFVGAMGFGVGVQIAAQMREPAPWDLLIAIGLGILGALLAILLQKLAIALAGFVAGGRLALSLSAAFLAHPTRNVEITFLIGGILGAILLLAVFNWVLILFSSVEGARLIASAIVLPQIDHSIFFIALVVLGVIVQGSLLSRSRRYARD